MTNWHADLNDDSYGQPILCGDTLILAGDKYLAAYDSYSGQLRWQKTVSVPATKLAVHGSSLFVLGNPTDFGIQSGSDSNTATNSGGIHLFHHHTSGLQVVELDGTTGTGCQNWAPAGTTNGYRSLVIQDSILMLLDAGGVVTGYDLAQAPDNLAPPQIWQVDLGAALGQTNPSPGPVALGDQAIFFVIENQLVGINVASGEIRWRYSPKDDLSQVNPPAVGMGLVVIQGNCGVYRLDWRTGKLLSFLDLGPNRNVQTPAILWDCDCMVLTTNHPNQILACHLGQDQPFWQASLDTLYAGCDPTTQVLSPLTDASLARIPTGCTTNPARHILVPSTSGQVVRLDLEITPAAKGGPPVYSLKAGRTLHFGNSMSSTPVLANGTLFACLDNTNGQSPKTMQAQDYDDQTGFAAYFPLNKSVIETGCGNPVDKQGKSFSLEAWVKTGSGGDLINVAPDAQTSGFRLRIVNQPDGIINEKYGSGCLQFLLAGRQDQILLVVAQSQPTRICDGSWHHVAVTCEGAAVTIFMDGTSQPITTMVHRSLWTDDQQLCLPTDGDYFVPDILSQAPPLTNPDSPCPITIGAYLPGENVIQDPNALNFQGLIADVRVWNTAISAKEVKDRMGKLLTGHEPLLAAYWPLNEPDPGEYQDLVANKRLNQSGGSVAQVTAATTPLALDMSLYPYLLNQATSFWPYQDRWVVRGEDAPKFSPVASGDTLCFVTDRALFAVDQIHGTRKWAKPLNQPSALLAGPSGFMVIQQGLLQAYQNDTGQLLWETTINSGKASAGMPGAPVLALTDQAIVVSSDRRSLVWLDGATGALLAQTSLAGTLLGNIAGDGSQIFYLDGTNLVRQSCPISGGAPQNPETICPMPAAGNPAIAYEKGLLLVFDGTSLHLLKRNQGGAATPTSGNGPGSTPSGSAATPAPAWIPIWTCPCQNNSSWPAHCGAQSITGINVSTNTNRAVVTTNQGLILLLALGSGQVLNQPIQLEDMQWIYPAVIEENIFYCTARGTQEKQGGCIAAYDLTTGQKVGYEPCDAPPAGPPHIALNTAYFGVDDGQPGTAALDHQALHSVVFGSSFALKREPGQAPIQVLGLQDALCYEDNQAGGGFDQGNFSMEGWVNAATDQGGDLILVPAATIANQFYPGFRLAVGSGGRIHAQYFSEHQCISITSPPTVLLDQKWHHVAAVFKNDGQTQLGFLYLDGHGLTPVNCVPSAPTSANPTDRRLAQIGGDGTTLFNGLMQSIRLWDTWLHAAEIADRRCIKLVGDEANLVADWDFTPNGIQDSSTNQLHADPTPGMQVWLSPLMFSKPDYPYLVATTQASGWLVDESQGVVHTVTNATFVTNISARGSDGKGLAKTQLKIWASATVLATLEGEVDPITLTPDTPFCLKTGTNGNVTLNFKCGKDTKSPELWIWADKIMYPNERFHVSPVMESQKRIILPPPKLVSQSSVIQDYRYAPGDSMGTHQGPGQFTLHDGVDITTIRTTVTAESGQGNPLPYTALEIWATDVVDMEVRGITYRISPQNSANFVTDGQGALTMVWQDASNPKGSLLDMPALSIRAGFMPRMSRVLVYPSEQAHQVLSSVTPGQLSGDEPVPQLANKKEAMQIGQPGQQKPMDRQAAEPVAKAIGHIMALTKKPGVRPADSAGAPSSTSACKGTAIAAAAPNTALLPDDHICALHHAAHLPTASPITPSYMPAPHFVFSFDFQGNHSYSAFNDVAGLQNHLNGLGLKTDVNQPHSSGQDAAGCALVHAVKKGFEDAAHGVEDLYNDAKHLVVRTWEEVRDDVGKLVHYVEVIAYDAVKAIGRWVIRTVKDVIRHLVAFLEKIWVILKYIYLFLRALFDWKQILAIHDVLREAFQDVFSQAKTDLPQMGKAWIQNLFTDIEDDVAKFFGSDPPDLAELGSTPQSLKKQISGSGAQCVSSTNSGKGKYLRQKWQDHDPQLAQSNTPKGNSQFPAGTTIQNLVVMPDHPKENESIVKLLNHLFTTLEQQGKDAILHFSLRELLGMVGDLVVDLLTLSEDILIALLDLVTTIADAIMETIDKPLNIPFISQLYHLITGDDLTILDLLCLIAAIPINIVLAIKGTAFNKTEVRAATHNISYFQDETSAAAGMGVYPGDGGRVVLNVIYGVLTVQDAFLAFFDDIATGLANQNQGHPPHVPKAITTAHFGSSILAKLFLTVLRVNHPDWKPSSKYHKSVFGLEWFALCVSLTLFILETKFENSKPLKLAGQLVPIFLGLSILGVSAKAVAADSAAKMEEAKFEDILSLVIGFLTSMSFLNFPCMTRLGGEPPISSIILACIDAGGEFAELGLHYKAEEDPN